MLMSKLSVQLLSKVWQAVDVPPRGKVCRYTIASALRFSFSLATHFQIDIGQLQTLLAVLGQVQRDEPIDVGSVTEHSAMPMLAGLKAPPSA